MTAGANPDGRPSTDTGRPGFRGDVDGLRAVAILLVVLFHAHLWWPGGFVGVDVFFVISGYLITRNLLAESDVGARVHLATFWAKRVRRLLPAMALMIAGTTVASLWLLAPLGRPRQAELGLASVLYVSNIAFAHLSTDYFADAALNSPFLHTWSLGVEEQFYLVWPLLFVGVWMLTRRSPRVRRAVLAAVFVGVLAASFALAVLWSETRPEWAFYMLPTRAWEFAAAGLLAMWMPPVPLRTSGRAAAMGLAGFGLVLAAGAGITPAPSLPVLLVIGPVAGTMLMILAGAAHPANVVSRALAAPPLQWLGRMSYSWYLWHWPFIVLAMSWTNTNSPGVRAAAAAASLPVAVLTSRLVENPIRRSPRLAASNLGTFGFAAAVTGMLLGLLAGYHVLAQRTLDRSPQREIAAAKVHFTEFSQDMPCEAVRSTVGGPICDLGATDGSSTVVLVGDSHAVHWAEAFAAQAREDDIRLVLHWAPHCPAIDVREDPSSTCRARHDDLDDVVEAVDPDAVVLANSTTYGPGNLRHGDATGAEAWEAALDDAVLGYRERGIRVGIVEDNPVFPMQLVDCLSLHGAASERCRVPLEDRPDQQARIDDAQVAVIGNRQVTSFSVTDVICPDGICGPTSQGISIYADSNHLNVDFTMAQRERIRAFYDDLLGRRG